ncbi:MAG: alanine dehydrogenase [Gammaproteobacteria bacterium]|nr:alanine dehydrogenase [Gammaproteobacteria bacterium]MBU1645799.1 alanine dehydrogenase [Gammaproteobacteria bacterium]MBU1971307.1 alanine dehydrogenase [Gammaproteobacteria bacterium]
MIVGCPRETKNHEYRVGLTPAGVAQIVGAGGTAIVEANAGARVGFADADYIKAGARIAATPAEVYGTADMIVKVKELQPAEFALTHPGQILFGYHHFAPEPRLLQAMLDAGVSCIAYETVSDADGGLPLLAPMSCIAGRLAPQVGAWALQMANGGSGVLLGGVPAPNLVAPAKVVVIGAGSVGANATQIAVGMGAAVTLFDRSRARLADLAEYHRGRIATAVAEPEALARSIAGADLVIGAVLVPGKSAPHLIDRALLRRMRPGSVLVDVAIDQGGVSETSRPTSHTEPLYVEEGIVHYCVTNMPAAVARTATLALTQATLPHVLALVGRGLAAACTANPHLAAGLQTHRGGVCHRALAEDSGRPFVAAAFD